MASFGIARYLPDGRLDEAFGEGGKVVVTLLDSPAFPSTVAVHVGLDDSITVCGQLLLSSVGIVRLGADGEVRGTSVSSFLAEQTTAAVQKALIAEPEQVVARSGPAAPGQPAAAGATPAPSLAGPFAATAFSVRVLAIGDVVGSTGQKFAAAAAYGFGGQLDPAFGNDGTAVIGFDSKRIDVRAAAFSPRENRIVIVTDGDDQNLPLLRIARLLANGSPDPSFGVGGKTVTWFHKPPEPWIIRPGAVTTQAGAILIAGSGTLRASDEFINKFVVARLSEAGGEDRSFGEFGVGVADFGRGFSRANSVRIDARGRIIAAGVSGTGFALARFRRDGKLDLAFNGDGMARTVFDEGSSEAFVAKVDSVVAERIVVAGSAGGQFALARYREDGTLDSAFGSGGRVRTVMLEEGFGAAVLDITFDSQQRIIAAGPTATTPPIL